MTSSKRPLSFFQSAAGFAATVLVFGVSGSIGVDATVHQARLPQVQNAEVIPSNANEELLVTLTPKNQPHDLRADSLASEVKAREARVIMMEVTAYCPCQQCCGPEAQGLTASGKHVSYNEGRFVAADTRVLPFGTQISVPGYNNGEPVEVLDRGGAIKGNRLDVYFPHHETALQWGRRTVPVVVIQ